MERQCTGDQKSYLFTFIANLDREVWKCLYEYAMRKHMEHYPFARWRRLYFLGVKRLLYEKVFRSLDYPLKACIVGAFARKDHYIFEDTYRMWSELTTQYSSWLAGEIFVFPSFENWRMNCWNRSQQDSGLRINFIFSTEIHLVNEQENHLKEK